MVAVASGDIESDGDFHHPVPERCGFQISGREHRRDSIPFRNASRSTAATTDDRGAADPAAASPDLIDARSGVSLTLATLSQPTGVRSRIRVGTRGSSRNGDPVAAETRTARDLDEIAGGSVEGMTGIEPA